MISLTTGTVISGLGIEKTGGLQNMVNCPYPVNYYNRLFRYDTALGNYLVNVHNLVFTIRGVLEPDQPDPVTTLQLSIHQGSISW